MEAEEAEAEAAAGAEASTPPAPQRDSAEQGDAQQDGTEQAQQAQQQAQQEEEEGPESMVDFLLRRQLSPGSPEYPAASSADAAGTTAGAPAGAAGTTAGAAGMPDVPPPSAWNSVGPLRCWHAVGSGEAAVAQIARRLAGMEVRVLFTLTLLCSLSAVASGSHGWPAWR